MFVNKILSKSLRPLLSHRVPRRTFFANDKSAQEGVNNQPDADNDAQDATREQPAIKLAEFAEDELRGTRITHKTLLKSLEPYKQHNQTAFEKLSAEIESLYKDKDSVTSLRQEIRSLDDINKLNHEKLQKAVERIKASEQEALDIEARLSKEIEKSKTYAISKFSSEVLEILDNLELCMDNAKKNKEVVSSDFYEGVDLSYKHALGIFKRYNILPIEEGVGAKMNPNYHDVIFTARDENKAEGEVIHVAKRGYRLGERVLRASKVGVVRND